MYFLPHGSPDSGAALRMCHEMWWRIFSFLTCFLHRWHFKVFGSIPPLGSAPVGTEGATSNVLCDSNIHQKASIKIILLFNHAIVCLYWSHHTSLYFKSTSSVFTSPEYFLIINDGVKLLNFNLSLKQTFAIDRFTFCISHIDFCNCSNYNRRCSYCNNVPYENHINYILHRCRA